MTIRFVFNCSCCGSNSFRPSARWTFKDSVLRKIGFYLYRCFHCSRRFYLFNPMSLRSFLLSLDAPADGTTHASASGQTLNATDARWWASPDSNV
jgi:hypothetical protein